MMSEGKTVLVVFRNRRPITFASGKIPREKHQNSFEAVVHLFMTSSSPMKAPAVWMTTTLQRESEYTLMLLDIFKKEMLFICVLMFCYS